MDHSAHSLGHEGGHNMDPHEPIGPMYKMNMVFTWDWQDMCVVFRWWHVQTAPGLLLSLCAIVALGAGYEYVKQAARKYAYKVRVQSQGEEGAGIASLNYNTINTGVVSIANTDKDGKLIQSTIYAIQVAYSFMLMLVFMTYNGWAMIAVILGAFLGHYAFSDDVTREMSCH